MTLTQPRRPSVDEIPIIDLHLLRDGSMDGRRRVAERIGRADEDVREYLLGRPNTHYAYRQAGAVQLDNARPAR